MQTSLCFSSSSALPASKKELQMLLVSQKSLPVVLQMGTHFSKEKYNMGRPFACLKLPDLSYKQNKPPHTKPHSKQYWSTPTVSRLSLLNSSTCLGVC